MNQTMNPLYSSISGPIDIGFKKRRSYEQFQWRGMGEREGPSSCPENPKLTLLYGTMALQTRPKTPV
ncbi:unnamed protein product [Clavelina lepadiformis]|uniref:Uncharacterized protein n=1 Tax=Clavelina lepadiformis TaxID=159417 RepID=A0ABP0EYJ7_CLALP